MSLLPPSTLDTASDDTHIANRELIFKSWKPQSDIFMVRYGNGLFYITSAIAGWYINTRFRRKLKMGAVGAAISYGSCTVGPPMLLYILIPQTITEKITTWQNECMLCLQLKATAAINCTSILYPAAISTVLNLANASSEGFRVPRLNDVREVSKFVWSVMKPMAPKLGTLFILNSIFACLVIQSQVKTMDHVKQVLDVLLEYNNEQNIPMENPSV